MVDTTNTAWLLVDLTHARITELRDKATQRHAAFWPNNVLSVTRNDANTQALVKIEGVMAQWKDTVRALLDSGVLLQIYTRTGVGVSPPHSDAVTLLAGAEWSNTRIP